MSLTSAQILTVKEAIHDMCALATNVDFVFPTETRFTDKADYWRFANTLNDTAQEIETQLINGVWLSYLRFSDSNRFTDSPVKTIVFQATLFNESTFARYDEDATADTFERKLSVTDHAHDVAAFSLQIQFQGLSSLGLDSSVFAVGETISIAQIDNTQREVPCSFVPDAIGSLTRFEIEANVQLVAC